MLILKLGLYLSSSKTDEVIIGQISYMPKC